MTFQWELKHKSCVVFIIYLSSALTQHSIYKRHNGCFQVDLISVSPRVSVQVVNEGLWDDRPDSVKYLYSDLIVHRHLKPCASFRPPGIASSHKQSVGSAAWPPEPSCAHQAPGKQHPWSPTLPPWFWCSPWPGSERWCWCSLDETGRGHGPASCSSELWCSRSGMCGSAILWSRSPWSSGSSGCTSGHPGRWNESRTCDEEQSNNFRQRRLGRGIYFTYSKQACVRNPRQFCLWRAESCSNFYSRLNLEGHISILCDKMKIGCG